MTTEPSTVAADPWAKPQWKPIPETPEERERGWRQHQQAYDNMEYLDEIFDDLLREHRGRLVIVYGNRQVLIGDDRYEMDQCLTEDERRTSVLSPITEWWIRYGPMVE